MPVKPWLNDVTIGSSIRRSFSNLRQFHRSKGRGSGTTLSDRPRLLELGIGSKDPGIDYSLVQRDIAHVSVKVAQLIGLARFYRGKIRDESAARNRRTSFNRVGENSGRYLCESESRERVTISRNFRESQVRKL